AWADLKAGLPKETVSEAHLTFLSKFDLSPEDTLSTWGNVARQGYSVRARGLAARQLRFYVRGSQPADLPAWRGVIVEIVGSSEAVEVLRHAIPAALSLGGESASENADAIAALGEVLRSPATRDVHAQAVCAAHALSLGDPGVWSAFTQ